jgi:peptide/nickel transport system permease protein
VAQFLIRRLVQFVPVLLLTSVLTFTMMRLIPGDPATVMLGPTAKPEQITAMRIEMGLNQPIVEQYFIWLGHIAGGDFGKSFINDFPVSQLIVRRLPATLELAIAALTVALVIGVPLGLASAIWRGKWPDQLVTVLTSVAMGIPDFWLGILLILLFALRLNWLPSSGYASIVQEPTNGLRYILLPAFTLGAYIAAVFARFIKSSLVEVLNQDYIRTARSKGLSEQRVIWSHALRNALIPLVTVFALQLGGLLGGVVITESIFDWPGLGRLLVTSIQKRDYSIVQAIIMLAVLSYLTINLIADLSYGSIDPRLRHRASGGST